MEAAPGEGSEPQEQRESEEMHGDDRDQGAPEAQSGIREVHDDGRDRGKAEAQNEIEGEHDDGRDQGTAAAQSKIEEVRDDNRDRGTAAAQNETEEVHDDGTDRGKAAAQSEIQEVRDDGTDRGKAAAQSEIKEMQGDGRDPGKSVAPCEIEEVPEDVEKNDNSDPSLLPLNINELWAWALEMERRQMEEEEAAEASRTSEISRNDGSLRGKLKKAFGRVKDAAAVARWGDGSRRGLSLAEIGLKFKKLLKKGTWRRRKKVRRYGGLRLVKKRSKFVVSLGRVRGRLKTRFTKLADKARRKKRKHQQE